MYAFFVKWAFIILLLITAIGGFLRFYKIKEDPPGLYVDEVSIGLNAYDILKTGKDQYGMSFPLAFKATGEYKLSVYIYLTSIAMEVFGKNEFAVRFFSAFFGTLTIPLVFFFSKKLLGKEEKTLVPLITTGIFAISPWALQFSRAGFEATVALFFYLLSLVLFLLFMGQKKLFFIFLSTLSLALCFYTYNGYRLLVPLTFFLGTWVGWQKKPLRKIIAACAIIFCLLCIPLIFFSFSGNGLARFNETSAFSHMRITQDISIFTKNYLSYFSINFLFRYGDQITRHHVEGFGLLYLWELPYLFIGLYVLLKTKNTTLRNVLFFLFLAGPLLPATTVPSPHALRLLYGVVPSTMLVSLGFFQIFSLKKKVFVSIFALTALFIILEPVYYLYYYYVHYPKEALIDWGGSCKEVAMEIQKELPQFSKIIVDGTVQCSQDYFSFYAPGAKITYISKVTQTIFPPKTLLVTKKSSMGTLAHTTYLPNQNHDIFAQFYTL